MQRLKRVLSYLTPLGPMAVTSTGVEIIAFSNAVICKRAGYIAISLT
ncbi:MAG: hypothetical protein V3W51_04645 [Candidatus Brocadiales bacterium]